MMSLIKKEFSKSGGNIRLVKLRGGHGGKVLFFVFFEGKKNPSYCLKMGSHRSDNSLIEAEFNELKLAKSILSGNLSETIPEPLNILNFDGYLASCEEAVFGQQFPRAAGAGRLEAVFNWICGLHQAGFIEKKVISKDFLIGLISGYREKIPDFNEERYSAEKISDFVAKIWPFEAELPLMKQHGDLHFANIFLYKERLKVVDWSNYGRITLPFYDLFFFLERQNIGAKERDRLLREYGAKFSIPENILTPWFKFLKVVEGLEKWARTPDLISPQTLGEYFKEIL